MEKTMNPDTWCILRTAGPRTLLLAKALAAGGLEVWTPIQTRSRRKPRSKERKEIAAPMMPTYVFARSAHLPELRRCLSMPVNPFPAFSIFHYSGRIPIIGESEIASLRAAEQRDKDRSEKAASKSYRRIIPIGQRVSVAKGGFAGLSGIVEGGDGKFALVAFGGSVNVKIATFLIESDSIEDGQPQVGTAAKAA